MRWIGQHIYDQISRFRNDVYLESTSTTADALNIDCDALTTGSAINLDIDDALTASATKSLAVIDYDKAGVTASGQTSDTTGLDITLHDNVEGNVGTVKQTGINIDLDMDHAGGGTHELKGIVVKVGADGTAGVGDIRTGVEITTRDSHADIKMISHQDAADYATIGVTTSGATTLTTVDAAGAAAHFEIAADGDITLDSAGQIKLEPVAGNNILLDGTIAIDAGVVTGATSITSTSFVGALTGQADTVATIAGLAPNTATTQASQPNITGVGTIGTGVWQGTTIKTAYIGDDQVTEDKLADTLLAEIDANTAKATNVATNLTASTHVSQIRINSSDGDNVIIAEASGSIAGVMSVTHHDKLDAIEASATADQSKSDIDGLAITTVGTLDTGNATAIVDAASATAAGKVELATTAEAITGTDTARAVTPAGLKARISQIVNLQGYAVLEDDNYQYSQDYVDNKAPFLMSQDYGSGTINSSTEVVQKFLLQAHGFHVPFTCEVGPIQVQVACGNAGNISVALVEYVPSNAAGNQNDYPRTIHETVVVVGTGNLNKVNTVDVTAANVDNKTIAAGSHLLIMVKGDGTSAGGTAIIRTSVGLAW